MINLDQSEYDFFDNMEVIIVLHIFSRHFHSINSLFYVFFFTKQGLKAQQALPILNAHLTILKSYIEHLKLLINEREYSTLTYTILIYNILINKLENFHDFSKRFQEEK